MPPSFGLHRDHALEDRERMTAKAVCGSRQADNGAILEECRYLAHRIKTQLSASEPGQLDHAATSNLQALLERAAAVLKTM